MSEDVENILSEFAQKYKIAQGLKTKEHINLLKEIERLPDSQAIKLLNYFLTKEINPDVLIYIIKRLSKYRSAESTDSLLDLLLFKNQDLLIEKKPYIKARSMAAKLLGQVGGSQAVTAIMYILNSKEENYRLRLSCADALGSLGDSFAVSPLIGVLSDESENSIYLKESAAKALGMLGDERALDPLVSILETKKGLIDKFTFLKERVIEALGKIHHKDRRTVKALKKSLMDESPYIRIGAIEALSQVDDTDVVPLIEEMINDEEHEVQKEAINALYNIHGINYLLYLRETKTLKAGCLEEIDIILEEENERRND